MKTNNKRILSLFLAVLMMFSVIPVETINAYALTGNQRTDIISIAKSELGNTNGSKYTFGAGNVSWCAYFIVWCARQANIDSSIIKTTGWADADDLGVKYYSRGSYTPKTGDIIIFDYPPYNTKTPASSYGDHVGLVEYVESNTVHTIEGNSSPSPNAVRRHSYSLSNSNIKGYGVPNYKSSTQNHTVDSSYGKNFIAYLKNPSGQTPVYDANHNLVSGRYISGSDPCTIHEVYTDGCCKVSYVTDSGETRTYYTKYSYFKVVEKDFRLHVWASTKGQGYGPNDCPALNSLNAGNAYYIWFKIAEKTTGEIYSGTNYKSKISIYYPDGSELFSTYDSSGCNWIRVTPDVKGTYRMRIQLTGNITGDYSEEIVVKCDGKVSWLTTSLNLSIPNKQSGKVTGNLTGTYPNGAKYDLTYDKSIISIEKNDGFNFTVTGLKAGTTNLVITTYDKKMNYISSATCKITVTAKTYTVKYNANGGTGAPAEQIKTHGVDLVLSKTTPTKTGYIFDYWSSNSNGSGFTAYPGGIYQIDNDRIWYAQYNPIEYTVKYNANGGYGSMADTYCKYDKEFTLNSNNFTRNGYTFLGWSQDPKATNPTYRNENKLINLTQINGATITLYAVWQENHTHIYNDVKITKQPTCTQTGIRTYTCSCGATKTETIPSTGHTIVIDPAVKATCTTSGRTEGSHCSVCGTVIKQQSATAPFGHKYDSGKITTQANCYQNGVKTYTCTACGATKTETIPKTSHSYSWKNLGGYIVNSCNNCTNEKVRLPFEDLYGYEYYGDYIAYTSVYNKFITGTNPPEKTLFSPTTPITRAMFVTILYRMAGEPYKNGTPYKTSPFTDITDTSVYYYDAACWALKNGITTETTFKPFDNVTREQTATFLYRYAHDNDMLGGEDYKNVNLNIYHDGNRISHFAVDAMKWANYNSMITGTEQGYANPQGATQRIHATKILYGFGKACNIGNFE